MPAFDFMALPLVKAVVLLVPPLAIGNGEAMEAAEAAAAVAEAAAAVAELAAFVAEVAALVACVVAVVA